MKPITFFDTEVDPKSKKVFDFGSVKENGSSFHSPSAADFITFLQGSQYLCGHNIFHHDLMYIETTIRNSKLNFENYIDTLFLSSLLFPAKPYHALLKDDKLQTEDTNNPLNDSIKVKDLFFDEITAFQQTDSALKRIFYFLLKGQREFRSFFHFIDYKKDDIDIEKEIRERFHSLICEHADFSNLILKHPIELAYSLALINTENQYSITPPWVLKNFPEVERMLIKC